MTNIAPADPAATQQPAPTAVKPLAPLPAPGTVKPMPIRPHGAATRGITLPRGSLNFDGRFGRIFRALPSADFGETEQQNIDALTTLAGAMRASADPLSDDPDPEEGGIPAVYTYFGQFIDHDLTFDPASSLQKQDDPDALIDFRTPRFDLDNIYGRGPDDQPYLFDGDSGRFILGRALTGAAANPHAQDLPRSTAKPARAIIGDPRNDENTIVSQLQGLFHRFHNAVRSDPALKDWSFDEVQREVRWHYQWVVLNDFLPTLVHPDVINAVLPHLAKGTDPFKDPPVLRFYKPRSDAFIPLEFAVAAYRFGHSMVRPGYRLNEMIGPLPIFTPTGGSEGLTGFREFPSSWAIDWNLFADLAVRDQKGRTRTQLAYRIDTSLVNPLGDLPDTVGPKVHPLALRNLLRGWRLGLPNGQDVARAMGVVPLADNDIKIGKFTGDPGDIKSTIDKVSPAFAGNCPLWTYVLAETDAFKVKTTFKTTQGDVAFDTPKLGPVGGRIVAETLVGLLMKDSSSYLQQDPLWKPRYANGGKFRLADLIRTALTG